MEKQEFIEKMEKKIKHHFKYGQAQIKSSKNNIFGETITIKFGILESKDYISNIFENDPIYHLITINKLDNEKWKSKALASKIAINPTNEHHAMGFKNTRFRSSTCSLENMYRKLSLYLLRLELLVKEEAEKNNIYKQERYDKKYFELVQ